jgi:hypothetical protein
MPRFRNSEGNSEQRALQRRDILIRNRNLYNYMAQLRDNLNNLNRRNLSMREIMFVRNARNSAERRGYTSLVGWNAKKTLTKFKEAFNTVQPIVTAREAARETVREAAAGPIYTAPVNNNKNHNRVSGVTYNKGKPVAVINP